MTMISTVVLALSMSADSFAAAIGKGLALKKPTLKDALYIGAIFAVVQTITPIIGWLGGLAASSLIKACDHWVAFIILVLVGGKMVVEGFSCDCVEKKESHNFHVLLLTAIATSIDAMAVGITFALVDDMSIWVSALAIGAATLVMSALGVMTGHFIGARSGKIAEAVGGMCLIVIGAKILFEHMTV